ARLIGNAEDNPQASAARLFPNAAAANRSIFYDRSSGRARSVFEVYAVLQQRYASAAASSATQNALAAVGPLAPPVTVGGPIAPPVTVASATVSAPAVDNTTYLTTFHDARPAPPVTLASASPPASPAAPPTSIFRSLFQDGGA